MLCIRINLIVSKLIDMDRLNNQYILYYSVYLILIWHVLINLIFISIDINLIIYYEFLWFNDINYFQQIVNMEKISLDGVDKIIGHSYTNIAKEVINCSYKSFFILGKI